MKNTPPSDQLKGLPTESRRPEKASSLREAGERQLMQKWQKTFPYLEDATLRLIYPHLQDAAIRLHFYPVLENYPDIRDEYFKPSTSTEEKTIKILADMVMALLSPEITIPGIINKAMVEIKQAYRVILQEGGGWSSVPSKSSREKRKNALLEWYQRNQVRLLYLRESYLKDERLYEGRGGQEKRDFQDILLIQIIKHLVKQKIASVKIRDFIKNFKNSK
jgi:hypothetical protein